MGYIWARYDRSRVYIMRTHLQGQECASQPVAYVDRVGAAVKRPLLIHVHIPSALPSAAATATAGLATTDLAFPLLQPLLRLLLQQLVWPWQSLVTANHETKARRLG